MIDTQKRQQARNVLLRFADGNVTNDEFESEFPIDSPDRALKAIYRRLWFLWDDRYEHRLKEQHALSKDERAIVDRCLGFLSSNLEYEWPETAVMAPFPIMLARLLHMWKTAEELERRQVERLHKIGDIEAWPFLSINQYEGRFGNLAGQTE